VSNGLDIICLSFPELGTHGGEFFNSYLKYPHVAELWKKLSMEDRIYLLSMLDKNQRKFILDNMFIWQYQKLLKRNSAPAK